MNNLRLDAVCSKQDEFEVILPWLHQRSGFEIKHGMYPRFSDFSFSKMSSRSHFTQNLTELFTLSEKPIMIVNQFPGPFFFPVTFEGINMNEKYSQIHSISIYINGERWFELPNLIVHVLAVGWSESTARFVVVVWADMIAFTSSINYVELGIEGPYQINVFMLHSHWQIFNTYQVFIHIPIWRYLFSFSISAATTHILMVTLDTEQCNPRQHV